MQTPPANSTGQSNSKGAKPALPLAPVPGAAPAQLVNNLLQADAATGNTVSAPTTGAPQTAHNQGRAAPSGQAGDVDAPQALITGLQQAASLPDGPSKLTLSGQATAGTPAADAGQNSTSAGTQGAAPSAVPPAPAALTPPAAAAHAGNLASLIQTATSSSTARAKGTPSAGNSSGTGQADAGSGVDSPAPQVAQASTPAADGPGNSQSSPRSTTNSSSGVAEGQQVGAITLVGNSFAEDAARQSAAPQAAPADSLPAASQVSAPLLPSTPATSTTNTLDKGNAAQPSNTNDAVQTAQQQGLQNPGYLPFGAAPPSLQLHSTSFATGQSGSTVLLNPAQVIDQAAYAVQYSHANGQQMQLHLNPPELGALQVDVSMHDGVLSARIEAQTSTTQQILVDNISQLKDSLTQQGVSFDRIDVHLAGSNAGSAGSGTADRSFAQQQDAALPWDQQFVQPEIDDSALRAPVQAVRTSRVPLTSLDIMI